MEEEKEYCSFTHKICYSQKEAGNIIRSTKRNRKIKHRNQNIPQRSYYCRHCGAFHLTHYRNFHTSKATLRKCGPRGYREFFDN
jgi:hypothetical protein